MRGFIRQNLNKDKKPILNSWRIAVSLGRDPQNGKYQHLFQTVRGTKREAEKRLGQLIHEHDTGKLSKPGKDTLGEYLDRWLSDYIKPNFAEKTYELYDYLCQSHIKPILGKTSLTQLKPEMIQRLYSEKKKAGLSSRTVQLIHVAMNKSLKNAAKIGLILRNPVDLVEAPRIQRCEMHVMNENDIQMFLEVAKETEYHVLFYFYLFSGMRRSELLAIRWSDVELLGMTISVARTMQYVNKVKEHVTFKEPKTKGSKRLIALSPAAVITLNEHQSAQDKQRQALGYKPISGDDLVFCHQDGSPLLPDSISHAWMKMCHKCGLKGIRLHDARHSMASLMLLQGVHPKIVQERLGHSSISTTLDTYSHVVPGLQKAAASKLDDIFKPKGNLLDRELKEIIQK